MRRFGELILVLAIIAIGGWALHAKSSKLQLMFLISRYADGSHCYFVKVDGAKVETHGSSPRPLSTDQLEEVALALEAGHAWSASSADYTRSGDAVLYTQIFLQQGSSSRRVSWRGFGPREFRLVDRLLASPVGPELREAIRSAAGSLRANLPSPPESPRRRIGCVRQEHLLERAAASRVVPLLEYRYPEVLFIMHPTMNGFYAVGSSRSVLALKNDVPGLDQLSFLNRE